MDCKKIEEHLTDIAEKTLSLEADAAVRRHLRSCRACGALVKRFNDVWQAWDEPAPVDPSPHFWTGLSQRLQAPEETRIIALPPRPGPRQWLKPAAAAAAVLAGIFAGYHLGNFPAVHDAGASRQSNAASLAYTDERLGYFDDYPAGSLADTYLSLGEENGEAGL
jgi:hypothetical protein